MSVVVRGKRGPVRPDSIHVQRGRDTRRRILDAARQRILADGFEALRLEHLAADVGVTKPAVIKSLGGKASILLELGEQDRATRVEVIQQAITLRTGTRRRVANLGRRMFELDLARMNVVQAFIGYLWFWTGPDHDRVQANLDDTRALLGEMFASASSTRLPARRQKILALRLMAGYVIGLRDLRHGRATLDEAVHNLVELVLD